MTKPQREQVRELTKIAKQREAADMSGKNYYRVRGPPGGKRVVKIAKLS